MTLTTDQPRASSEEMEHKEAGDAISTREFEAIFLEHWPRVYRVLVQLVGDRDEAEDLAIETFWRLYNRPPGPDRTPGTNLGGWLYRVATNLGLNAIRAWKRRQQYESEAVRLTPDTDPAESLARAEERRRVRQVLYDMKPRQMQLLLLRYSGLSYKELADALDLSVNSIGALLARAEREFETRYRQINPDGV